jgi:DNA-directed RNA polymerase specialized sigma24 family protein
MAPDDLLALNDALEKLEAIDKVKAELVKLRFFAGLTCEQSARALGISVATAERYWAYARSWLRLEVMGEDSTRTE